MLDSRFRENQISVYNKRYYLIIILSLTLLLVPVLVSDRNISVIAQKEKPSDSADSNEFNFVAAGDFACDKNAKKTVKGMIEQKPELILALGDLSYENSGACWIDLFPKKYHDNVKVTLGYHDVKAPNGGSKPAKQYIKHFDLDKEYYSFNYKNVHFLTLSTEITVDKGSKQYKFVKKDLEKASKDENIDWIVVFGYRPMYSTESQHKGNADLRTTYHPLFDKYGVDVVLNAHNHNYQRTFPIEYNDGKSNKPKIINTDHDVYSHDDDHGPIFLTVGTGGESLHPFEDKSKFIAKQIKAYGFLEIKVKDDPAYGKVLEGYFHKNSKDEIADSFTLYKDQDSDRFA